MAKRRTSKPAQVAGRAPEGIRYAALKGMGYRPTVRDTTRRDRSATRRALKRGEW
jgi:hypothetical protein